MGKNNNITLLAIRTLRNQGEKILGNRWLTLVDGIRQLIAKSGVEDAASSDELMLFSYPNPYTALTSLLENLEKGKIEFGWNENYGALPVQIVIHPVEAQDFLAEICDPVASLWNLLQQEAVYITEPLQKMWQEVMDGRDIAEHTLEEEGYGFFHLVFPGKTAVKIRELFSYRALPVQGKLKECFYCGMTNHASSNCPSKLLTMKIRGMEQLGYLTFDEINSSYKKIFLDYSACSAKLAAGVKPAQLRKDKELLVFVSYFDLNYLYQLRFLVNIAFNLFSKWEAQGSTEKINIDSHNLHMGLDCLRVRQYERAGELLTSETKRQGGKQFYACIGLAFWALEQGRSKDMVHYLERAKNIASMDKERLYSHLLLSRYYELENDSWKAKEALNNAAKINFEAVECVYRKMQHNVRYGFDEIDIKRLHALMVGQQEIFMSTMIDPQLLPVQGIVNDLAVKHIQAESRQATQNLARAEAEFAELSFWLPEKDPIIVDNRKAIAGLQKKFKLETYYDLLDVAERAKGIAFGCERIRNAKMDELQKRIKKLETNWTSFNLFWQAYQYKSFFISFQADLVAVKESFTKARALVNRKQGEQIREVFSLLEQAERLLKKMSDMQERMIWLRMLFSALKIFVKNIIVIEIVLLVSGFLFFWALPVAMKGSALAGLISETQFQKKSMVMAAFFFAPMVALMLTLWRMKEKME